MTRRARDHKDIVKFEHSYKRIKRYGNKNLILLFPYDKQVKVKTFIRAFKNLNKFFKKYYADVYKEYRRKNSIQWWKFWE